jgi:hypothetical protein
MVGEDGISMDDFRVLAKRSGLVVSDEQLEVLRPVYDHYAKLTATLYDLDLGAEDLAVTFWPAANADDQAVR